MKLPTIESCESQLETQNKWNFKTKIWWKKRKEENTSRHRNQLKRGRKKTENAAKRQITATNRAVTNKAQMPCWVCVCVFLCWLLNFGIYFLFLPLGDKTLIRPHTLICSSSHLYMDLFFTFFFCVKSKTKCFLLSACEEFPIWLTAITAALEIDSAENWWRRWRW